MKNSSLRSCCKKKPAPDKTNVNINLNAPKRINFIDTAKGIGILLVVFSFHMPLFFFISGMVFNTDGKTFGAFLKKKAQTLACPYVLFYIISILFYLILDISADSQNIEWGKYGSYFLQMFISQGSRVIANIPLWFIPCLLAVEIIYFFISKLKKPIFIIVVSAIFSASGWLLESGFLPFKTSFLPWSLDSALFVTGFFTIANLSVNYIVDFANTIRSKKHYTLKIILLIILCFAIVIPLALYNGKISLGSKILNNGFILYLTGIWGTFAILGISLLLEKCKFLLYLGKNSFYIMALHYLFKDGVIATYKALGITLYDKTDLLETILPTIVVFMLTIAFLMLYNKIKAHFINLRGKAVQPNCTSEIK